MRTAPVQAPERRFGAGLWRLADPKISLASMASMLLGLCAAAHDGPLSWAWLAVAVAGIFAIEVAKNASGEVFDFDSGADPGVAAEDRSPFSGGKRVLVDGLLSRRQTWAVAAAGYVIGAACGLAIVVWREPGVLWLGVAGLALAWFYQGPPLRLSYRGLGEAAVAVAYGPLVCVGTYLVQRGEAPARVVALSAPLGTLVAGFLWACEFTDVRADRAAGKWTLVARLGRPRAGLLYGVVAAAAGVMFAALPRLGWSVGVCGGLAGLVPALGAARLLARHPEETPRIIRGQAFALAAFVLAATGAGAGLLLTRAWSMEP